MDNFGSHTLADRVCSHISNSPVNSLNELRDNSADAGATTIMDFIAIPENGTNLYCHIDNGKGMDPFQDLDTSQHVRKGNDQIGHYSDGACNAYISLFAELYVFSKKENGPLQAWKYLLKKMRTVLNEESEQGRTSQEISYAYKNGNTEVRCIYGPFAQNDDNNPIPPKWTQKTFDALPYDVLNDPRIADFWNGKTKSGTAIFGVADSEKNNLVTEPMLEKFYDALPYRRKNINNIEYFKCEEGKLIKHEFPKDRLDFHGRDDHLPLVIDWWFCRDTNSAIAEFAGRGFSKFGELKELEKIKKQENVIHFSTKSSFVDLNTRDRQMDDLCINDFKLLNLPVIETEQTVLGIANATLPPKYPGRSAWGHLEGLNERHRICIPKQHQNYLAQVFGINSKKDNPSNMHPNPLASAVYDALLALGKLNIGKFKKYKGVERTKAIERDLGFTQNTKDCFPDEDVIFVLQGKRNKTKTHQEKWDKAFGVLREPTTVSSTSKTAKPNPVKDNYRKVKTNSQPVTVNTRQKHTPMVNKASDASHHPKCNAQQSIENSSKGNDTNPEKCLRIMLDYTSKHPELEKMYIDALQKNRTADQEETY